MHYADGLVARDPFLQEWSVEQGGLNANFAEPKNIFRVLPRAGGPAYNSTARDLRMRYPVLGVNLARPVLVALGDLRAPPPLLFGKRFTDFTGKPATAIERALSGGKMSSSAPATTHCRSPSRMACSSVRAWTGPS